MRVVGFENHCSGGGGKVDGSHSDHTRVLLVVGILWPPGSAPPATASQLNTPGELGTYHGARWMSDVPRSVCSQPPPEGRGSMGLAAGTQGMPFAWMVRAAPLLHCMSSILHTVLSYI